MSNDALLAHIVSQTQANVDFLVQNNYVTQADASGLLRKLLSLSAPPTKATPVPSAYAAPPIAPRQMPAPSLPPAANVITAKALWDYNKSGADADDLSFAAGDIITIVEETNDDWWMGEVHGRRALFPSNYVEKIASATPALPSRTLPPAFSPFASSFYPMAQPPAPVAAPAPAGGKAYKPFMASHSNAPPPPGAGTNTVGLQQEGGQDQKKSKFGKYGNTMAHSAAGGVGFGAGAAIGGGLVRAIF
ncbi:SH3 domain-containing protein [Mucidula mucida]|nr:SH3 domain-containing protein [Mucidula mucida]